jgi:hypothetical protein
LVLYDLRVVRIRGSQLVWAKAMRCDDAFDVSGADGVGYSAESIMPEFPDEVGVIKRSREYRSKELDTNNRPSRHEMIPAILDEANEPACQFSNAIYLPSADGILRDQFAAYSERDSPRNDVL